MNTLGVRTTKDGQVIAFTYQMFIALFCFLIYSNSLTSQVVINEIMPNGTVELKNIGNTTEDVSSYWLCDFPEYQQIGSSNLSCGSMMLAPNEILVVNDFNTISNTDGEMGLYATSSFSSSNDILDYVEWGSSGHVRASVAIAAGIWPSGAFVPAFAGNESLEYSGSGDDITSWSAQATPTICAENGGTLVCEVDGGTISTTDPTTICVDGNPDPINVIVDGSIGTNSAWIITDANNNILALPPAPPFDLDGAGDGVCILWFLTYEDQIAGNDVGNNLGNLIGCFDLSNGITVTRQSPDGGTITLTNGDTEADFCAGDVVFDVQHSTTADALSFWYIITNDNNEILGFHDTADGNTLDLSAAPSGTCRIWGWSFNGLGDPIMGDDINSLSDDDCEAISSNFVSINRFENGPVCGETCMVDGGTISTTDPTTICVDGNPDPINVIVDGSIGTNSAWIITDANNNILALPPAPPFDLDGAGDGVCILWFLTYEDQIAGNDVGNNLGNLIGCFDLSNGITVTRQSPDGGTITLTNGDTEADFCAGDVVFDVQHSTTADALSFWYIITNDNNEILGFHDTADGNTLDLSAAPSGTCRIWGWSFNGLGDPIMGDDINSLSDDDCEAISSNFVSINRFENGPVCGETCMVDGGTISTTDPTTICVDGNPDPINVIVDGSIGTNSAWIITDANNNILALPPAPPFDLDGAGDGVCILWFLTYEDQIAGNDVGNNLGNLIGCFDLSNGITVTRQSPDGGTITLTNGDTEADFCAGDVVFDVQHSTTADALSFWYIITNDNNEILGFHDTADGNTLDLSAAPSGTCRIWGWSFNGLGDPIMGDDINSLSDDDCEAISSNFVSINRFENGPVCGETCMVDGGTISTTDPTTICVDGNPDPINVIVDGSIGTNSAWIITDANNNILALPPAPPFDLDGAGDGVCILWFLTYEDQIAGNDVGNNLGNLIGCFDLSNGITVTRQSPDGGTITLTNGDTEADFCAGDVVFDVQHSTTADALSFWYIITNDNNEILGFHDTADGNTLDLSAAPSGTCRIWGWSFNGLGDPIMGDDINSLSDDDCEAISSNFVSINRFENGPVCETGEGADLALNISSDISIYEQYEGIIFTITATNQGDQTATDIIISAPIPEGMVHSENEADNGEYSIYHQEWDIESLAPGETATLYLDLFTLVDDQNIINFVEVIQVNENDPDSTPANGNGVTPTEDDEAAITIMPIGGGGTGNGEGDIDLELSIEADSDTYNVYEHVTYTYTLTNNGNDAATNVFVNASLPDGMVHSDNSTDGGDYSLYRQRWEIDYLGAGETITLELVLFPLVSGIDIVNYTEVFAAEEQDVDSTPNNGNGVSPIEDDEAAITLSSTDNFAEFPNEFALQLSGNVMVTNSVFPNPAVNNIQLNIASTKDVNTDIMIVDVYGKVVYQAEYELIMGMTELQFDISDLNTGQYFIKLNGIMEYGQAQSFMKIR